MIIHQQKSVGGPHGAKVWLDLVLRSTDSELLGTPFRAKTLRRLLAPSLDQKPSANGRGYNQMGVVATFFVRAYYIEPPR